MQRVKKIFGNLLMLCFGTALALLVVEIACRIIYRDTYTSNKEFRLSRPEPYKNASYFSEAFVEEAFTQPGGWTNPPGTRLVLPNDFSGKYYNTANGFRNTEGQPSAYQGTIHVFGGSTVYCSEVPDAHTLPSQLQKLVNDSLPVKMRVVNYGMTSANTAQQLERLEAADLQKGDIVIFYDGVNDAFMLTTGKPGGWIMGENEIEYGKLTFIQRSVFGIYNRFHDHSRMVQVFFYPYSKNLPVHLTDSARLDSLKTELKQNFIRNITIADSIVRSKGGTFLHFLQPTLFTRKTKTAYEQTLSGNDFIIPKVWEKAVTESYGELRAAMKEIPLGGRNVDLTGVFDDRKESFYLDFCHLAHEGNAVVAGEIFRQIRSVSLKTE